MPQNFKQTQNHRFSWDLHHPTPLRRGFISQNIFGLRTVHMGVTGTLIFRLTKQIEHILRNLRFFWDSSHVNILEPWKKYQNFRLVPCTVHRPWQKFVRKINFFKFFFDFFQFFGHPSHTKRFFCTFGPKITYSYILGGQHVHLTPKKCFLEAHSTKCPWILPPPS